MEITRLEEVTRIYCDICGRDITHEGKSGAGLDRPNETWVACTVSKFKLKKYEHTVQLSCSEIARFLYENPVLCYGDYIYQVRKKL